MWQTVFCLKRKDRLETPNISVCTNSEITPEKKFISYEKLCELYGGPHRTDYHLVYDGYLEFEDLDDLYEKLTTKALPKGFVGRRLSMSDMIELCDDENPTLYYVDAEDYILTNWKE